MAQRQWSRMTYSLICTLTCLYTPFLWDLWPPYRGNYRQCWLLLFPILPGLLPGMYFHPNDTVQLGVMGITTLLMVLGHTWIGTRHLGALLLVSLLGLAWSTVSSLIAYAVYRA